MINKYKQRLYIIIIQKKSLGTKTLKPKNNIIKIFQHSYIDPIMINKLNQNL